MPEPEQGRFEGLEVAQSPKKARRQSDFFVKKKPAAVLKHGVVRRHLPKFAGKLGSRSPTGRVSLLETHAGAGYYQDGSPGSPAFAITTADALAGLRNPRDVRCLFVEMDPVIHARLSKHFETNPHAWIAPQGKFEERFDLVMAEVGRDPLFAFIDPYGFLPPFSMIRRLLQRSDHLNGRDVGPPTELLINFSVPAVRRTVALVDSSKPNIAEDAQLRNLDVMLGGTYWRELCRDVDESERVGVVLYQYMRDLQHVGPGWMVFAVPVGEAPHLEPIYYLVFCTRSDHGVLSFSEAASLGVRDYYAFIKGVDPKQLELNDFGLREWVPQIASNIETLLHGGDIRVLHHLAEIYDTVFGLARGTHLRKAVRLLNKRGVTPSDGSGDLEDMMIISPPAPGGRKLLKPWVARPIVSHLALAPPPLAFDLPTA
jgi:three-Cys-motif partner protein